VRAVSFSLLMHFVLLIRLSTACFAETPATHPGVISRSQIDAAIARGVKFLENNQTSEGCWGTGTVSNGNEIDSMVPGSHDAFRLGTTALAVMALREVGEHSAHDRGVQYLLHASDARRDDGSLIYNTWANIYVTQAMAEELLHSPQRDPRLVEVAERNIRLLVAYATFEGGWNYYDFGARTEHVSLGPTSFGTAAGLVALYEARQAKIDVPQKLIDASLHRLEEMRLSDESFLYGSDYKYLPLLPANTLRGAVGRTQPAHFAIPPHGKKAAVSPRVVVPDVRLLLLF
jgi:hypothetical protein